MSEKRFEVTPYAVKYMCDECDGEMVPMDGIMLTSNPPQYKHKCQKCGYTKALLQRYPTIKYEYK